MEHFLGLLKTPIMKLLQSGATLSSRYAIWHNMVSPFPPSYLPLASNIILCLRFEFALLCRSKFEGHYQWRCLMGTCPDFEGLFSRRYKEFGISDIDIQPHSSSRDEKIGNKNVITEQSAVGSHAPWSHFSCTWGLVPLHWVLVIKCIFPWFTQFSHAKARAPCPG